RDEVNLAMGVTGMKGAIAIDNVSMAVQGNALANLLGSVQGDRPISHDTQGRPWARSAVSEPGSLASLARSRGAGGAPPLCQSADVEGRPRIVQLDDVVLSDLEARVGHDLHAFLINRGDAPGFETGRVAFLTDIGCFAFDEETFGEDVDNVTQAEHGLTGEA